MAEPVPENPEPAGLVNPEESTIFMLSTAQVSDRYIDYSTKVGKSNWQQTSNNFRFKNQAQWIKPSKKGWNFWIINKGVLVYKKKAAPTKEIVHLSKQKNRLKRKNLAQKKEEDLLIQLKNHCKKTMQNIWRSNRFSFGIYRAFFVKKKGKIKHS